MIVIKREEFIEISIKNARTFGFTGGDEETHEAVTRLLDFESFQSKVKTAINRLFTGFCLSVISIKIY